MATKKQDKRRRTRNTGGLSEIRPGVWRLFYQTAPTVGSKRQRRTLTFNGTKTQAMAKLTELQGQVVTGEYVERNKTTLIDYLRYWLDDIEAREAVAFTTLRGYRQKVEEYIIPTIGTVALSDLQPEHVLQLHRSMTKKGLGRTTVTHAHTVLNTAMNHAVKVLRILRSNPCLNVVRPKGHKREMTAYDVPAYQRFMRQAEASWCRDVFHLAFATGTRRSEVLGLRWRDVDLKEGTVTISGALHRKKGAGLVRVDYAKTDDSQRVIAVDEDVTTMLEARKLEAADTQGGTRIAAWKADDYVFTTAHGRPFDPDQVSKEFTAIRKAAGIDAGRLHDARHSVATWLLADGEDPQQVAALLGHSTTATTFRFYSHAIPGRGKATAARLTKLRAAVTAEEQETPISGR